MKAEEEEYPHNNHESTESEKTKNALQKLVVMVFGIVILVTCSTCEVRIRPDLDQNRQSNKRSSNEVSIGPKFGGHVVSLVRHPPVHDGRKDSPQRARHEADGHDEC